MAPTWCLTAKRQNYQEVVLAGRLQAALPWKTIEGEMTAPAALTQLEVLLRGVFDKRRFLDLIQYFIVFEHEHGAPRVKKIAGYHQFHAVNVAVAETIRAAQEEHRLRELKGRYSASKMKDGVSGDHRIGVIWHTQHQSVPKSAAEYPTFRP